MATGTDDILVSRGTLERYIKRKQSTPRLGTINCWSYKVLSLIGLKPTRPSAVENGEETL